MTIQAVLHSYTPDEVKEMIKILTKFKDILEIELKSKEHSVHIAKLNLQAVIRTLDIIATQK